jgi:hypothetical protein
MNKVFWLLIFIAVLIAFNLSYLANSGLFIFNLKGARRINYRNVRNEQGNSLAKFTMEEFMSEQDANTLVRRLRTLKLERRNAAMSTYGTASYLDGANLSTYRKLSSKSNIMMRQNFSDLLEHVLQYFRARTSSKVMYHETCALPGFHVFDCNALFSYPVASVHKDMQFLRTGIENISDDTLSFTLALEVPDGGAGLYTFDSAEANLLVPRPLVYNLANKTYIEYKTGWMVTHGGQTYHMIGPSKQGTGQRITLQGHGVYQTTTDTWFLYW